MTPYRVIEIVLIYDLIKISIRLLISIIKSFMKEGE